MGSDLGSQKLIEGAFQGASDYQDVELILVGDPNSIQMTIETLCASTENQKKIQSIPYSVIPSEDVILMTDDPLLIRKKTTSSMRIALNLLADGKGDALISCGNTGALQTGATLFVKRIEGIHRAAIGAILPMDTPLLLLDSGANLVVTPEYLLQFAVMGSVYMEKLFGIENPRIGLLNIGIEEKKGTPLQVESYQLLKSSGINFVGNIEGKDTPFSKCDLLITDGFTGNVFLKTVEGMGSYMLKLLKQVFYANTKTKLGALLVKEQLSDLKIKMDARTYGGAPILGIQKPVIKAHGNSDDYAMKNAVRQAHRFVEAEVINGIRQKLSTITDLPERKS
jgi:glycerol-3-phosphate acyltransferase PlsX